MKWKLFSIPGKELAYRFVLLAFAVTCVFTFGMLIRNKNSRSAPALARAEDELPIYSVDTDKKQLSLSFNAAWGNEDIPVLLEILAAYDVKTSFFMTGDWVERNPDEVKMIAEAGHDLANHGENHLNMSDLSEEECRQEILQVHTRVKELTGIEMDLFRPPSGDYNSQVVKTAAACGYYTIQWDVDSLDWKDYGVDSLIKTVTEHEKLQNGSIILLHSGAEYTSEALEEIITNLQVQGYQIVPVSELIIRENYTLDHTGRQIPRLIGKLPGHVKNKQNFR